MMTPSIALYITPIVLFMILFPMFITLPAASDDGSQNKKFFHFKKPIMYKQWIVHTIIFAVIYIVILNYLNGNFNLLKFK